MDNNSTITTRLLERARAGDKQALNELIGRHRARLRRMVELRPDRRLQSRTDASGLIQEAYVEVVMDRGVLSWRHFEDMSLAETAL